MPVDLSKITSWTEIENLADCLENEFCAEDPNNWKSLPVALSYLDRNRIQSWLLDSEWFQSVISDSLPPSEQVLQHLLTRHLLDLETRNDTSKLEEFWEFATSTVGAPESIRKIWGELQYQLKSTLEPAKRTPIREQENKYSSILRLVARKLQDVKSMQWAAKSLSTLAEKRSPKGPITTAYANVVVAWNQEDVKFSHLRPGLLLSFELGNKTGERGVAGTEWLGLHPADNDSNAADKLDETKELFDPLFNDAMVSLASKRADWYPIIFDLQQILPSKPNVFTGASFALAIGVAQELANIKAIFEKRFAMASYIAITATADPDKLDVTGAVDRIDDKVSVMLEEGVRAIVVSSEQENFTLPEWAEGKIDVIRTKGPECTTAKEVGQYTFKADLERKDCRPIWPPSRRDFLAACASLSVVGMAGAQIQDYINRPNPTDAMRVHQSTFSRFESLLDRVSKICKKKERLTLPELIQATQGNAKPKLQVTVPVVLAHASYQSNKENLPKINHLPDFEMSPTSSLLWTPDLVTDNFKDVLQSHDPVATCKEMFPDETEKVISEVAEKLQVSREEITIAAKPNELLLSGFVVESDSKCFDNSLWFDISGKFATSDRGTLEARIKDTPLEPGLMTRVIRFSRSTDEPASEHVAFEFTSSGYGVLPVAQDDDDISLYITEMDESAAFEKRTITTVIRRPLKECTSIADDDGKEVYETTVQAIYFNSWQDQTVRRAKEDWWGTRVKNGALSADLAIAFPPDAKIESQTQKRYESGHWSYIPYKHLTKSIKVNLAKSYYHKWSNSKLYVVTLVVDGDRDKQGNCIYQVAASW